MGWWGLGFGEVLRGVERETSEEWPLERVEIEFMSGREGSG